ncbi:MAG: T9SS type A sorting domain-containing protein [Bacteroidota bacterium]
MSKPMRVSCFLFAFCFSVCSLIAQGKFTLLNGANLVCVDDPVLHFSDMNTYFDGMIEPDQSILHYSGSIYDVEIDGSGNMEFYKIILDIGSTSLFQYADLTIYDRLTFNSGIWELNLSTLFLEGILENESEVSYLTGQFGGEVVKTEVLNNPISVNPGNLGSTISSSDNLGVTTIRRGHVAQSLASGSSGVFRYYDVRPTNQSSVATLRLFYRDQELNGVPESELDLWRSLDQGLSFSALLEDGQNTLENWLEIEGVNPKAIWTMGGAPSAVPLDLLLFQGELRPVGNQLSWVTAQEVNTDFFELQRSLDGHSNWRVLTNISAAGNSHSILTYSWLDEDPPQLAYYRLRMVDLDGSFTYSPLVVLERKKESSAPFLFPNPTTDWVEIRNKDNSLFSEGTFRLFNAIGQQVLADVVPASSRLDLGSFPAGTYWLEITSSQKQWTHKLVIH